VYLYGIGATEGTPIFDIIDTSLTHGKIALYSWANAGSRFDEVCVTEILNQSNINYLVDTPFYRKKNVDWLELSLK